MDGVELYGGSQGDVGIEYIDISRFLIDKSWVSFNGQIKYIKIKKI